MKLMLFAWIGLMSRMDTTGIRAMWPSAWKLYCIAAHWSDKPIIFADLKKQMQPATRLAQNASTLLNLSKLRLISKPILLNSENTIQAMNRNNRKVKKANHGKRPVNRRKRRAKRQQKR
eukprot:maker-scaffold_14-snap-gene-5.66-mRNA-1 protein AED:0.02 eAED:0.02 QI:0/0.5/0.33/0.66/1/1/3/1743/118